MPTWTRPNRRRPRPHAGPGCRTPLPGRPARAGAARRRSPCRPQDVLDLGCAAGRTTFDCATASPAALVLGIDANLACCGWHAGSRWAAEWPMGAAASAWSMTSGGSRPRCRGASGWISGLATPAPAVRAGRGGHGARAEPAGLRARPGPPAARDGRRPRTRRTPAAGDALRLGGARDPGHALDRRAFAAGLRVRGAAEPMLHTLLQPGAHEPVGRGPDDCGGGRPAWHTRLHERAMVLYRSYLIALSKRLPCGRSWTSEVEAAIIFATKRHPACMETLRRNDNRHDSIVSRVRAGPGACCRLSAGADAAMAPLDSTPRCPIIGRRSPAGDNLEFDPAFAELERLAQGKPEQQYGKTIVPAEDPDWKVGRRQPPRTLMERTYDLRVMTHLAVGPAASGAASQGYAETLGLIRQVLADAVGAGAPATRSRGRQRPDAARQRAARWPSPIRVMRVLRYMPLARSARAGGRVAGATSGSPTGRSRCGGQRRS